MHRTPVIGLIRDSPFNLAMASNSGRTGSRFRSKSIESLTQINVFNHRGEMISLPIHSVE